MTSHLKTQDEPYLALPQINLPDVIGKSRLTTVIFRKCIYQNLITAKGNLRSICHWWKCHIIMCDFLL